MEPILPLGTRVGPEHFVHNGEELCGEGVEHAAEVDPDVRERDEQQLFVTDVFDLFTEFCQSCPTTVQKPTMRDNNGKVGINYSEHKQEEGQVQQETNEGNDDQRCHKHEDAPREAVIVENVEQRPIHNRDIGSH